MKAVIDLQGRNVNNEGARQFPSMGRLSKVGFLVKG